MFEEIINPVGLLAVFLTSGIFVLLFQIKLGQKKMEHEFDQLRSDLQQTKELQEASNKKLDNIQADTTQLLKRLNEIPGIPQDILDLAASIKSNAGAIDDKAASIDEQVPDVPEEEGNDNE